MIMFGRFVSESKQDLLYMQPVIITATAHAVCV